VAWEIRALVGDQVSSLSGFLSQLQPASENLEICVPLDQSPPVFCPEVFADPERPLGIAIFGLQLQVAARRSNSATLFGGEGAAH